MGTMNNVKLLHIKHCFFQFFNSPVALKNKKNLDSKKKMKWRPCTHPSMNSAGPRPSQKLLSDDLNLAYNLIHVIQCTPFLWFNQHTKMIFSKLQYNMDGVEIESDLGLCPWDWSTRYCTNRRERPSLLDLLSEIGLISDGWLGSISPLEIEPMHLSVEGLRPWDWSYPVLQYLREWPTPTVVSSYDGYCRKTPTTNQPTV